MHGINFVFKQEAQKQAFYTTRYVEGSSKDEAIRTALNLVRNELKNHIANDSIENNPQIFIEEIIELESFDDIIIPGFGFSWYEEK